MKTLLIVLAIFVVIPFLLYFYGRIVTRAVLNTWNEKHSNKYKKEESNDEER